VVLTRRNPVGDRYFLKMPTHWVIRNRRAFSAHGRHRSCRVDPQATDTTSTRPVMVSIRRMASGRTQTPGVRELVRC
jgi:hypothetical protein